MSMKKEFLEISKNISQKNQYLNSQGIAGFEQCESENENYQM